MTSTSSAGRPDVDRTGDEVATDEVIARRMGQAQVLAVAARQLAGGDVDGAAATCLGAWVGLSRWFLAQVARDPGLRGDALIRSYERATRPLFDRGAVGGAP